MAACLVLFFGSARADIPTAARAQLLLRISAAPPVGLFAAARVLPGVQRVLASLPVEPSDVPVGPLVPAGTWMCDRTLNEL